MTAIAGHLTKVFARADATTPTDPTDNVDGVDKNDLQLMCDLLDSTDFKDTSGGHTRIPGLKDVSLSISGKLQLDSAPQSVLRTGYDNGTSVYITIYYNPSGTSGQKGFQVQFFVEKENPSSSYDGIATCSWDLKATGLATRV